MPNRNNPGSRKSAGIPKRFIAFLRAINVGGHTVKMDVLRGHFVRLGLGNVETFIASGNVIFEAAGTTARELEERIEAELWRRLGFEVATFVRAATELARIVRQRPFDTATFDYDQHSLYIGFLGAAPAADVVRNVLALRTPSDELHVDGRELYWGRRGRFSDSEVTGATLERVLGAPMTVRNVTTIRRLAAKYC
jgi:uncharacterized protein (DUF1697 family)